MRYPASGARQLQCASGRRASWPDRLRRFALCLLAGAALQAGAHDTLPPGIDWIDADVDRALKLAQTQHRPVFLYWGAAWCPPCNQVKAVLFRRAAFQNRMRGYVAVYLDGDGEAAQRWGEHFGVVGYPTLLVLRPDGTELTRLPGEAEPERIVQLLDLASDSTHPLKEVLVQATQGATLNDGDWRLLASYSWDTDQSQLAPAAQRTALLSDLARRVPARLAGLPGRLWLQALANSTTESKPWERGGAFEAILALLGDPHLARENLDVLGVAPSHALAALAPLPPEQQSAIVAAWSAALRMLESEPGVACTDRLILGLGEADLALAGRDARSALPPAPLAARLQALALDCNATTRDPLERQSVASAASDLLQGIGKFDEAALLLEAEVPRAHVPAYFMQERAALARKLDQGDEAILWSGLSYAEADGPATRLQWVVRHLQDQIHYTPAHHAAIADLAALAIQGAARLPDAFADRNLRSLERLQASLQQWSKEQPLAPALQSELAQAWQTLCAARAATQPSRTGLCSGTPERQAGNARP